MEINKAGLDLIKEFEGCKLTAYLCPAGVWTIGYGHTAGVKKGMKITQAQADQYLKADMTRYEGYVEKYCDHLELNANQFSALVSFTYNCGAGSLQTLVRGRTVEQIADALLLYNKANGKVLAGLVRRRKAEQALFNKGGKAKAVKPKAKSKTAKVVKPVKVKTETKSIKPDAAKSFNKKYAKTYTVKASSLNMRTGANTDKTVITVLAKNTKVTCYGYYTGSWLLVQAGNFTGYVSKKYLK